MPLQAIKRSRISLSRHLQSDSIKTAFLGSGNFRDLAVSMKSQFCVLSMSRDILQYENTPIQKYWKFHLQKLKIFR